MSLNITELSNRVKQLPRDKVKVKELSNGRLDILVLEESSWTTIAGNVSKKVCEEIVGYSPNRLILG